MLADTARTRRCQLHWLDVGSDELFDALRVLNGVDIDLPADVVRLTNRLRDALTSFSPVLERAVGAKLDAPGVRDLPAAMPTPRGLRVAGRTRIKAKVKHRPPRMADRIADAVVAALDAQTLTLPSEKTLGRVIGELASNSTASTHAATRSPPRSRRRSSPTLSGG